MGRTAGTRVTGDTGWSCSTVDARGRVTQHTSVGGAGVPTRTVTTTYTATAEGTRVVVTGEAIEGSSGSSITTRSDFLGRVIAYTDVWGTTTTPEYEPLTGRVLQVVTSGGGLDSSTTGFTYDRDGKTTSVSFRGETYASVVYDVKQRVSQVSYRGGSALAVAWDDTRGSIGSQTWSFPSAASLTDEVTRSLAGRIVRESFTHASQSFTSTYGYDGAGRLVSAKIPGHELSYEFASSGGCGPNAWAGASGNRTRSVDAYTAPGSSAAQVATTQYCYDWADRVLSTANSGTVAGANQITDGFGADEIWYDVRATRVVWPICSFRSTPTISTSAR